MSRAVNRLEDKGGARRMISATRLRGLGFAALASLALSGCISFGPKVPQQLLSLAPDTAAQVGPVTTGSMADAIVVLNPEADRSLDMLRVPVRVNASTIAYLQDIAWVEKPTYQFRALLAETLRTRTSRLVVEDGDFDVVGRTVVNGRLLAMGYDAPTQSVVVRVDMQRQDKGGAIVSRRFEAVIPGIEAKAAPVAAALGRASNDVAGQVATWITQP
jgi:cholesterol transport system auxiliary component